LREKNISQRRKEEKQVEGFFADSCNKIHIDNGKPDDVVRKMDDIASKKNKQTCFLVYGSGASVEDQSADVCRN